MQIGKGAECRSQYTPGHNSLLFLKDHCELALLSSAPCHLDKTKDYYSLLRGLGHQNLVRGAQSKLESAVSLGSLRLRWKCRAWDTGT